MEDKYVVKLPGRYTWRKTTLDRLLSVIVLTVIVQVAVYVLALPAAIVHADPVVFSPESGWNGTFTQTNLDENESVMLDFDHSKFEPYVSYWTMDELNAAGAIKDDNTTSANDCEIIGTTDAIGWRNRSRDFDGSDDYLDCGYSESLNITSEITIGAWLYMKDASYFPSVVTKSTSGDYLLQFRQDIRRVNLHLKNANPSWSYYSNTPVPLNEWACIVATYDGIDNISYYFNGNPDGTYTVLGGNIGTSSDPVLIGKREDGYHFNGSIDEVIIANRTWSALEVAGFCNNSRYSSGNFTTSKTAWGAGNGTANVSFSGTVPANTAVNIYQNYSSNDSTWNLELVQSNAQPYTNYTPSNIVQYNHYIFELDTNASTTPHIGKIEVYEGVAPETGNVTVNTTHTAIVDVWILNSTEEGGWNGTHTQSNLDENESIMLNFDHSKFEPYVSYWTMDNYNATGAIKDESTTNTNDCEIIGATDTVGWRNRSRDFDGSDDYLDCGNSSELRTDNVTVATWFKIDQYASGTDWQDIVEKQYDGSTSGWYLGFRSVLYFRWNVKVASGWAIASSSILPAINEWHCTVATWNGSDAVLYLNGTEIARDSSQSGVIEGSKAPVNIGRYGYGDSAYFNGSIDEVIISSGVWTQQQAFDYCNNSWYSTGNFTTARKGWDSGNGTANISFNGAVPPGTSVNIYQNYSSDDSTWDLELVQSNAQSGTNYTPANHVRYNSYIFELGTSTGATPHISTIEVFDGFVDVECSVDENCAATDCDGLDGCYGGTYRNYDDPPNYCTDAYECTENNCTAYTETATDADCDGYNAECDGDCDDANAAINPSAIEIAGNSVDENCDSVVLCDPSAEWKNHGEFVSCLSRYAAKSDVGKPPKSGKK